jgi:hypothetical protein
LHFDGVGAGVGVCVCCDCMKNNTGFMHSIF